MLKRVESFQIKITRLASQKEFEERNILRMRDKISSLETKKLLLVKAQGLIDRSIQAISANGIGKIQSVVSAGLQTAFKNPDYQLLIEKNEGARGNSFRLKIRKGEVTGEALSTFGGGISAVASFLLRIIMIKRFKLAKFMVLDESFNNVSPRDQPRVSAMMKKLVKDYGYTLFMITHQPGLIGSADRVYEAIPQKDAPPVLRLLNREEIEEYAQNGLQLPADETKAED